MEKCGYCNKKRSWHGEYTICRSCEIVYCYLPFSNSKYFEEYRNITTVTDKILSDNREYLHKLEQNKMNSMELTEIEESISVACNEYLDSKLNVKAYEYGCGNDYVYQKNIYSLLMASERVCELLNSNTTD